VVEDLEVRPLDSRDYQRIRELFDEYVRMYSSRDERLTTRFSEDFSGLTGGGDFLVKNREEWVAITRQDFAQIKDPIRIELKDLAIQSLAETIAVVTSCFTIHLPIQDHVLSQKVARLVLIFRKEATGWNISHSSISVPFGVVREGEVYPIEDLVDRNQFLEDLVAERTVQLLEANASLQKTNDELEREIAERKQTDEALQRSEELYRSIINASPDDITIADLEGHILMVSPAALDMFRCEVDGEFLGRPVTDFIVPEDRARAFSQVELRRQGVITGPSEYRGLRYDGSTFDIEVNSEFIRDAGGSPTGMVVIVRDITERKQAELDRKKLEATNLRLQKAESLGRMAGAIAHHFNNQLGAVVANLDMAMVELMRGGMPFTKITAAMKAANKAAEMSGLMLTYLGQSFDKRERLDLSATCLRSMPMLQAMMPRSVALEAELLSPGPMIIANESEMRQLLTNLTTNAAEAMVGGKGTMRVGVKTVLAEQTAAMHSFPAGWQPQSKTYACLEVMDAGCGVESREIEKLFDPFFSSKSTGRGMGLAVVLGIVRAHGGVVTVESQPGHGSTFRVFIPVAKATND
jgi:PAS domain S-box-containing protein